MRKTAKSARLRPSGGGATRAPEPPRIAAGARAPAQGDSPAREAETHPHFLDDLSDAAA